MNEEVRELDTDEIAKELAKAFDNLKATSLKLHPVKLLSKLALKYLCHSCEERVKEGNPINEWLVRLEVLSGLILANGTVEVNEADVTDEEILEIENLLDIYFKKIYIVLGSRNTQDFHNQILMESKVYSLHVRGESYPNKLFDAAKNLYSSHNDWFTVNLGFTIDDALKLTNSLIDLYNQMANLALNHIEAIQTQKNIQLDKFFLFDVKQLSQLSNLSIEKCEAFLTRLSQTPGYRNFKYPNTFSNAIESPWDFNTLYEKPIVKFDKQFFIPIIGVLPAVMLNTFYFDLIQDDKYRGKFGNRIGSSLENQIVECLKRLFDEKEIYQNIYYDFNGKREEVDVLIRHDDKLLIFQSKFKKITQEGKSGESKEGLISDFEKGIAAPMLQGLKAETYINATEQPIFYNDEQKLTFKREEIDDLIFINIVFGDYLGHQIQIEKINQSFKWWDQGKYGWFVSLFDFDVVTEILATKYDFLHYVTRRIQTEKTLKHLIISDEIDLLGFYLEQGLSLEDKGLEEFAILMFGYSSEPIDEYMYSKYQLKNSATIKPQRISCKDFNELIEAISTMEISKRTKCILTLLDFELADQEIIMKMIKDTKQKTLSDNRWHTFSIKFKNKSGGLCFVSEPCNGNLQKLVNSTASLTLAKKQNLKTNFWIGFGWDKNSSSMIDALIYSEGPNLDDPDLDKEIEASLNKGFGIDLKTLKDPN